MKRIKFYESHNYDKLINVAENYVWPLNFLSYYNMMSHRLNQSHHLRPYPVKKGQEQEKCFPSYCFEEFIVVGCIFSITMTSIEMSHNNIHIW